MYERAYAPGFHDLIFAMLRDARIVPNVSQTAAEISRDLASRCTHGYRYSPRIGGQTLRCFGNRLVTFWTRYRCLKLLSLSVNEFERQS